MNHLLSPEWRDTPPCFGKFVIQGLQRKRASVSGKHRTICLLTFICLANLLAPVVLAADSPLTGSITSDGTSLAGVAVSARADGSTFTTTVYTNALGKYSFPALDAGHYMLWAQAIGFDVERAEVALRVGESVQQNFSLKVLEDFSKQLSGSEWMASLPAETREDRRMKAIFRNTCADCHTANFILQNRFDKEGWRKVLDLMSRISVFGNVAGDVAADNGEEAGATVGAYREELGAYLAKARGPSSVLKYQPQPRLTGESARIVVTEYDIPRGDGTGYISRHTGSIWAEGPPSMYEGRGNHDIAVDSHGLVWFGDSTAQTGVRTVGKLDPKTGHVTGYRLNHANEQAGMANSGIVAEQGYIWLPVGMTGGPTPEFAGSAGGGTKRRLVRFDPKTEKFEAFPTPDPFPSVAAGTQVDSHGKVWIRRAAGGLFRFDPETKKWDEFKLSYRSEVPYGVQVDSNDNAWYAMFGSDQIGFVDHKTGISSVITLAPLETGLATAKDREIALRYGNRAPIWRKGPRRMGADKTGNKLWVAEFYGNQLLRIDINSKEVKEYPMPNPDYTPYDAWADKNHMVWICLMNSDRIVKFNPFTDKFTEYPLPTVGTESRMIRVDDSTDPPTVWVAYWRTNRIARVQFRTGGEE